MENPYEIFQLPRIPYPFATIVLKPRNPPEVSNLNFCTYQFVRLNHGEQTLDSTGSSVILWFIVIWKRSLVSFNHKSFEIFRILPWIFSGFKIWRPFCSENIILGLLLLSGFLATYAHSCFSKNNWKWIWGSILLTNHIPTITYTQLCFSCAFIITNSKIVGPEIQVCWS